jgi:EmrB/QacA subfamily drug resistance transporter
VSSPAHKTPPGQAPDSLATDDDSRAELIANVLIPLIVGGALFMQTLDTTVIATALPAIGVSMHEDPIRLNLAITSYLLSLAVFIPISGWAAERYGARTVFRAAIFVFTLGSILCGLSNSLLELIAARILQGMGGAMMVPVGRLVVLKTVAKSNLVQAMSLLTIPAVLGPVIGPPVGGFIVTYSTWRWIFFINVPVGVIGMVLVSMFIENVREPGASPLDLRGFLLTGFGLAGLLFSFEAIGRGVIPVSIVMSVMAGGGLCLGLYVIHARRIDYPIVDLDLIRIPTFAASVLGGGLFRMAMGSLPFLLAMLLQLVFGLSPFVSGLFTFASAVGALIIKFLIVPIVRRYGFRSILIRNGLINAAIMASYALFRPSTPYALIVIALLVGGFFRSLQFTSLNTLVYADVPMVSMSDANTLASMAQQLFLSLGVGIAALVLHLSLRLHGETALSSSDFVPAFLLTGVLTLLSVACYVPLAHHAGAEVSGRKSTGSLAPALSPASEG